MSLCNFKNKEIIKDDDEYCEIKLYKQFSNGLPTVSSLNDLIEELKLVFVSDSVNIDLVNYLMKSYKSNPIDWKKYAKFDRYR